MEKGRCIHIRYFIKLTSITYITSLNKTSLYIYNYNSCWYDRSLSCTFTVYVSFFHSSVDHSVTGTLVKFFNFFFVNQVFLIKKKFVL